VLDTGQHRAVEPDARHRDRRPPRQLCHRVRLAQHGQRLAHHRDRAALPGQQLVVDPLVGRLDVAQQGHQLVEFSGVGVRQLLGDLPPGVVQPHSRGLVVAELLGPAAAAQPSKRAGAADHVEGLSIRSVESRWPVTTHGAPVSDSRSDNAGEPVRRPIRDTSVADRGDLR